jgi:hypothetical protein
VSETFGRQLLQTKPASAQCLEEAANRASAFTALDSLTWRLIERSLAGQRLAEISKQKGKEELSLVALAGDESRFIRQSFLLCEQEKHGAWFLPAQCKLHVGNANFPCYFRRYPRFASGVVHDEALKADLRKSPDALYFWAILEPLFETLFRPFALRSTDAMHGDRDEQISAWKNVDSSFASLDISVGQALAVFRFGGGWSKLRTAEQIEAKSTLLQSLAGAVTPRTATVFRVQRIQELARRYYARSQVGVPTMRQVLTKPLQRSLSAYFSGDWLAFLKYIGEQPHPEERIAKALPQPKLYVAIGDRASAIAERRGVAPAEIEKMLKALWAGEERSPVEQRVGVLQRYWQSFDDIHAKQKPGMPSLWGLVEEGHDVQLESADKEPPGPAWYSRGCYRNLLPTDLVQRIDNLWDGVCLVGHPDSIVSAAKPHSLMAQTFGPALRFWHGCALTAWFVAEGPMSRTDMSGLAKYHARDLAELDALGFAISPQLFEDLIAAEAKLGRPQSLPGSETRTAVGGFVITMSTMVGSRRKGFEKLRDAITLHRRAWSRRHLDAYLRARWESEIRATANDFNRLFEQKGRIPTVKQFAKFAVVPANHWFGGNISDLYSSFGEKSPVQSERRRFLPRNIESFMGQVFRAIGGKPTSWNDLAKTIVGSDRATQDAAWRSHGTRKQLAEMSVLYVQLREASGVSPTMKEFGESKFRHLSPVLADQPENAWCLYSQAIEQALANGGQ